MAFARLRCSLRFPVFLEPSPGALTFPGAEPPPGAPSRSEALSGVESRLGVE